MFRHDSLSMHYNIIKIKYYIIHYRMLFRTFDGKLVEIRKYDFKNDKLYYEKIMKIKQK
jgi:hypothetical protein